MDRISLQNTKVNWRDDIISFLSLIFTCIAIFVTLYPFIKDFGYIHPESPKQLFLFHQSNYQRTNSIFLYIAGCFTFFFTGILYDRFILQQLKKNNFTFLLEATTSLLLLTTILLFDFRNLTPILLILRFLITATIIKLSLRRDLEDSRFTSSLALFFYLTSFLLAGLFLKICLSNDVFFHFTIQLFLKSILLFLTFFLLFIEDKANRYLKWLIDATVFCILIILMFKNDVAYFDYSIFLGPVNDLVLSKDILSNVVSIYGFFNIYFVANIFKLFHVHDYYFGLSLIVSILYIIGYSAIYLFLRNYTKSIILSVFFLFVIVEVEFFCLYIPIHDLPQATFLRFGSFLPVFFLLLGIERFPNKRWLE